MLDVPEETRVKLEDIKNQITLGESEVRRLRNLAIAEQYKVDELIKSHKWHEEETARLKYEQDEMKTTLSDMDELHNEALDHIAKADEIKAAQRRDVEEFEKYKAGVKKQHDDRSKELDEREKAAVEYEKSVEKRELTVKQRESETAAKIEKMASLATELRGE